VKAQLIKEIGEPHGKWGYKYKGYYIIPQEKGRSKMQYYAFYTPNFKPIQLYGERYEYTTLEYAKTFITWRIEDAITSFEEKEHKAYLDRYNIEEVA
jgi:hypothetical protein